MKMNSTETKQRHRASGPLATSGRGPAAPDARATPRPCLRSWMQGSTKPLPVAHTGAGLPGQRPEPRPPPRAPALWRPVCGRAPAPPPRSLWSPRKNCSLVFTTATCGGGDRRTVCLRRGRTGHLRGTFSINTIPSVRNRPPGNQKLCAQLLEGGLPQTLMGTN